MQKTRRSRDAIQRVRHVEPEQGVIRPATADPPKVAPLMLNLAELKSTGPHPVLCSRVCEDRPREHLAEGYKRIVLFVDFEARTGEVCVKKTLVIGKIPEEARPL